MRFGDDPLLAAQCALLPPPSGYRPWVTGVDGPMPPALQERARRFGEEEAVGATLTVSDPSHPSILIRSEPQIWRENNDGSVSRGCFQAGMVYVPFTASERVTTPMPTRTKLEVVVGVLTAISLTVGTVVTVASWRKRRK